MKTIITITLVFLSIMTIAQEKKMEREQLVENEAILEQLNGIQVYTYNIEGKPDQRYYGIQDKDLFNLFGSDGLGTIGSDTSFSKDDLIYISFAAIKALQLQNEQVSMNSIKLEEEMRMLRDIIMKNEEKISRLDEMSQKIEELTHKVEELEQQSRH